MKGGKTMKRDNRYVSKKALTLIDVCNGRVKLYEKEIAKMVSRGKKADRDLVYCYYYYLKLLHYWLDKANKEYFKNIGRS
jgi:hypothetical protein